MVKKQILINLVFFTTRIFFCIFFCMFFYVVEASAYIPLPSQIIRQQPDLLRNSKAFVVRGNVSALNSKITYVLNWLGPQQYSVTLAGLPRTAYSNNSLYSSDWTLFRKGKNCILKTDSIVFNCGAQTLWALIELSGQSELVAKTMQTTGWLSEEAAKLPADTLPLSREEKIKNGALEATKLSVYTLGSKPLAVVEFNQGRGTDSSQNNPLLLFEQTFLSPIYFRSQNTEGETFSIQAQSDVEVSRKKSRFSHVLANRLDVFIGQNLAATFNRQEKDVVERAKNVSAPTPLSNDTAAIREALSEPGTALLKALLLTH